MESVEQLTPTLTRIVFGGEGLDGFEAGEYSDNYVKLQFPRAGRAGGRAAEGPDLHRP